MQRINDRSPYLNEGAISQQSFRPADVVFSVQQDARGSQQTEQLKSNWWTSDFQTLLMHKSVYHANLKDVHQK